MPMNFSDMKSLKRAAELYHFRKINDGETEREYRKSLSEHVKPIDRIESFEILFGVGWDQWTDDQKLQSLFS